MEKGQSIKPPNIALIRSNQFSANGNRRRLLLCFSFSFLPPELLITQRDSLRIKRPNILHQHLIVKKYQPYSRRKTR